MAISPVIVEWVVGGAYFVAGPVAWAIFGLGMIKGRQRMSLLKRPLPALPSLPPRVSLLIPAKDEAARIEQCLSSTLGQDYPDLQVIAIDDRSVDGTGAAMDEIAARDPRLKVLHITGSQPPEGWVGKTFALHTGIQQADGAWLCFIDSDVVIQPDAVRAAVATAELREFDMISLLPRMESGSFWEGLIVPLAGGAVGAMYMLPLTNYNEVPSIAFANGQFLCIRRTVYEKIGGHEAVRDRFCEDVEIARVMKRRGFRPRLAIGNDYAAVRMYSSFGAIVRGWARNFYAGSLGRPWRILGALAFLVVCCFSAVPAIVWGVWRQSHPVSVLGGIGWLATAGLHGLLMVVLLTLLYRSSGNRRRYALLFPLGMLLLAVIFCRALWMCMTHRVEWRGTQYRHRMNPVLTRG
jgi:chlorobactene glucosyltransferase